MLHDVDNVRIEADGDPLFVTLDDGAALAVGEVLLAIAQASPGAVHTGECVFSSKIIGETLRDFDAERIICRV